jgi:hypothetical protein
MPGRKRARRLGALLGSSSNKRRGSLVVWAAALALTGGVANCSFPEYGFPAAVSGSGVGGGMAIAGAGAGGSPASGAGGPSDGGAGDAGAAGAIGGAGDAGGGAGGDAGAGGGSGGEPCLFPTPVAYPDHCFNHSLDLGESGTDCGGSDCAPCSGIQACTQASDCLSKQCATANSCVPLISLSYTPIDVAAQTRMPKFKLNLTYLDTASMSLGDLRIRYYYNHQGVTEPVIGVDSQATIDPGNSQTDISQKVLTRVHRFPLGPTQNNFRTDSYLEIGFNDSTTVTTGTKFVITQDLVAGNSDELFDQNSHYSFVKSNTAVSNEAITVYRAGQRIWGVEPPLSLFPECAFAFGVNMNGPALVVSGESLLAESEVGVTFSGGAAYSDTSKLLPGADAATTSLLSSGRTLSMADSAVWPVPNGKYWAYAWLTSTVTSDNGTLTIGGSAADKFFGAKNSAGARWGLLGPYAVNVVNSSLSLAVTGSVHVAGVKLYAAQ